LVRKFPELTIFCEVVVPVRFTLFNDPIEVDDTTPFTVEVIVFEASLPYDITLVVFEASSSPAVICCTSPFGPYVRSEEVADPLATGFKVKVPLIEVEARVEVPETVNSFVFVVEATRFVIVALSAVRFWM
jgi:hypothetical protein